jgi:hypothetical protein
MKTDYNMLKSGHKQKTATTNRGGCTWKMETNGGQLTAFFFSKFDQLYCFFFHVDELFIYIICSRYLYQTSSL